jgi:hypothetical protein
MRLLVTLLLMAALPCRAFAQYPWGYTPYNPGYRPYPPGYTPYYPPANRAPSSLSQDILAAHNAVRSRVGVPPLAWSAALATVAQQWANYLIATNGFSHRPDNRYGENLYSLSGGAASPAEVVATWAAEGRGYDVRSDTCAGVCGHYTQLVWRNTTTVGCGVATDAEREVWVCDYNPAGNVVGYRPY